MVSPPKFCKFGRLAILALSTLMTLGLSISHAKEFILTPVADASVELNAPDINLGTSHYLRVGEVSSMLYSDAYYSYLKFDLSVIPASYRIIGGTLSLYCSDTPGSTISLRSVADTTWSETGIIWNNRPFWGSLITSILVGPGWNSWTIPMANLPATGLVSFVLSSRFDPDVTSFYSKEYGSNQPGLAVTAVPKMAPVAINLLLLGN
jgi:acid phosphatase type 7